MAFTEAQLNAALDPVAGGRTITLQTFNPGPVNTTVYAIGVVAPFAGRSRFVDIPNSQTAAQAATQIQQTLS
jgi:hypothetical protein